MKNCKIAITIDGGGIRGVMVLALLNYLNQRIQEQKSILINDCVDFVSGTSTGAIISSSLVLKKDENYLFTINDLLNLYISRGPQLFNLTNPDGAQSEGLKLLLKRQLKNISLKDLQKEYAFVSYDQKKRTPFVFTKDFPGNEDLPLSLVLAACSAVPGYFDPVILGEAHLTDGIATAKNPAKITYDYLREHYPNDALFLLSIGTGRLTGSFFDKIEEEVEKVHHDLTEMSKNQADFMYYRLQPMIKNADPRMDNASLENIHALVKDSTIYMAENQLLLDEIVSKILKYKES